MPRRSIIVLVLLAVMFSLLGPAGAQNGTPEPGGADRSTASIGARLQYAGVEENEQATITLIDVQDPFVDFPEGNEPAPESRYVLLAVMFENTGPGPFEPRPADFVLQDADGFLWASTNVNRGDDVVIPDLDQHLMAPGDRSTGVIGFQAPAATDLARVFYQPESGRLLLLADLRQQPDPAPAIGSEVEVADPETGGHGVLSVTEVLDPYEAFPEGSDPAEGSRYVLVTLSVENTGTTPFSAHPNTILLHDADGFLWSYTSVRREEGAVIPDLQSQDMAPGNRVSGVVGFQIPASAVIVEVLYQPESGRLIHLAELQTPVTSDSRGTETTASTADAACAGIDVWFAETSDRIELATGLSLQAAELESPETLEALATAYSEMAEAQTAIAEIPAAAMIVNQSLVDTYTAFSESLTTIVSAGDDGEDPAFAMVEGMNAFNDTSQTFSALIVEVIQVATDCGMEA